MKLKQCKTKPKKHSTCKLLEKTEAACTLINGTVSNYYSFCIIKEHFLLSTTCQYWSIYLLKDLLQVRGKLTESHLLELTQVWTGKQQRGRKYGMQPCVTPQLINVFVRAHTPLSPVEINGKLLTEELIFRVMHYCLQEEKKKPDPQQTILSSVSKNLTC